MERKHANEARMLCDAIRKFNENENALENLEFYLSIHFERWLNDFARTPEGLATELKNFSEIQ